jgi:hypothetical protein
MKPDRYARKPMRSRCTAKGNGDGAASTSWFWIFLLKSVPDLVSIILLDDVHPR